MRRASKIGKSGFTMLEVLLAMVILSIISLTVWTTFVNAFRIRDQLDRVDTDAHRIRTLFSKLSRDVSMLYLVKEKKYNTLVLGKDEGLSDSLTFSTFSNRVYPEDEFEADQVIVSYYTRTNEDEPSLFDIYRWVYPYIEDDQYWGEKKGVLLLDRVKEFNLTYYDGSQFKTAWDTSISDFAGKVPQAVKLELELGDGRRFSDLFLPGLQDVVGGKPIKAAPQPSATASPVASPTPPADGLDQDSDGSGLGSPSPGSPPQNDGDQDGGGFDS